MFYRYIIETQIMSMEKRIKELNGLIFKSKDEMGMWDDEVIKEGLDKVLVKIRKSLKTSKEQLKEIKNEYNKK